MRLPQFANEMLHRASCIAKTPAIAAVDDCTPKRVNALINLPTPYYIQQWFPFEIFGAFRHLEAKL